MHPTSREPSDPMSPEPDSDTSTSSTRTSSTSDTNRRSPQADTTRSRQERAASLVEYALLIALIAVVLASAVTLVGNSADTSINGSASRIEAAG